MPKRDIFHQTVKNALQKDGWTVTYDPFFVPTEGGVNFFIDLGLESIIGAARNDKNVAIEIKSFDATTPTYSFYEILGQFLLYRMALEEQTEPWELYVAMSEQGYQKLHEAPIFRRAIDEFSVKLVIFNPLTETITKWIK